MVDRLADWLVKQYPRSHRERYGEGMREMQRARAADARARGTWVSFRFWSRELPGLAVSVIRAWRVEVEPAGPRRGGGWLHELRGAGRRLIRAPGFTVAAVGMLGLGLGASATVYGLVHRVMLRPLSYPESDRLVWLDHGAPGFGFDRGVGTTTWLYVRYAEASRLLDGIALAQVGRVTLTDGAEAPERVARAVVTASTVDVLSVQPQLGRWFEPEESGAVVIGHGLWQRRYGGARSIVGRLVRLDGVEREIIGVMPPEFRFPEAETELWTNQEYTIAHADGGFNYMAVARLKEDATLESLRAEMQTLIGTAAAEFGNHRGIADRVNEGRIEARPIALKEHVVGGIRRMLWMLLGAVGLVLAAAWANVANLFVVRSDARTREVAVRRAMGASRSQVARLFLSEGVLLSVAAWLLAIGLGTGAIRVIVRYSPLDLPRADEIAMDPHIVTMTLVAALLAGLALTAIPLLTRSGDASALRDGGRSATAGRGRLRFRSALMASQIALAVMLVAGAGLLVRSWEQVRNANPGFAAREVLFFDVGLAAADHPTRESAESFHERMRERIAALPGVREAAFATCLPMHGYCWGDSVVPDSDPSGTSPVVVSMRRISTSYFAALELPLRNGRAFSEADVASRSNVVILSEATSRRLFPEGNAVGRRVNLGGGAEAPAYTVIGVAEDAATESVMEREPELVFYLPMRDAQDGSVSIHHVSFVIATAGDPLGLVPGIRSIVAELDPNLAIAGVRTLHSVLARDRAAIAFTTVLLLIAAIVALVLGAFGIYAVIAWVVGRRTAEIGLRLALGARPSDVMAIVFRQAGYATAAGLLAGLASAALIARLLSSLLFGVQPLDAAVFGAAALLLTLVAAGAAAVPARRAWRLRPVEALRVE